MVHSIRNAMRLVAAAAFALLLVSCGGSNDTPAPPPLFSKTYIFGSSISDTGNACNLSASNCTPNPPYASPRWSNGPVFAELLAQRYGGSATPSRLGGTNYAYGGARTGPIAGTTQGVPNLVTQVDQFVTSVNFQANPQYLYIIEAMTVGNDISDALQQAATNPNAPATIITAAVTNVVTIANRLYASGARHILIANAPDVGKTPAVQAAGQAAMAAATQMSGLFNSALAQQLPGLRAQPGLNVYLLDVGQLNADAIANPGSLGYTNVTQACFNNLASPPTLCSTPGTYLYWDSFHPTAATHNNLYQRAVTAIGR